MRGRFTKAVAQMEHRGIPVDVELYRRIERNRDAIRLALIAEVDRRYQVYQGGTFRMARFEQLLNRLGLLEYWPRTGAGALRTDKQTMKDAARMIPELGNLRELLKTLAQLKSNQLAIGSDGRNRTLIGPYGTKTGRNAPSNSKYVFGQAAWARSIVRPEPGMVLAYLDFGSQEIGIAAALSGDERLVADYRTDPYLGFAKRIGRAPLDATKETHKAERDAMKPIVLGVNYGMGAESLARGTGRSLVEAERLLRQHQQTYPQFWKWSEGIVDRSQRLGYLETALGWQLYAGDDNPRSFMNFPMQAHGADILRLAACYLVEAGVGLLAPVHDAFLIEAPEARNRGSNRNHLRADAASQPRRSWWIRDQGRRRARHP